MRVQPVACNGGKAAQVTHGAGSGHPLLSAEGRCQGFAWLNWGAERGCVTGETPQARAGRLLAVDGRSGEGERDIRTVGEEEGEGMPTCFRAAHGRQPCFGIPRTPLLELTYFIIRLVWKSDRNCACYVSWF